MLGQGQAEAFSAAPGTSHILPSTCANFRLRAEKVLEIIQPVHLPEEEARFAEGEVPLSGEGPLSSEFTNREEQALIQQSHGALHRAKDLKIASLCAYDNPEMDIIFPTSRMRKLRLKELGLSR